MNLEQRIELLVRLESYLLSDDTQLQAAKKKAYEKNNWFTEEFIDLSIKNIAENFLDKPKLLAWSGFYHLDDNVRPATVGVVMAGNIPLVGFHDFLCVFISGHRQMIKLADKDTILMTHIIDQLTKWNSEVPDVIKIAVLLKDCDAYIATGSNNSLRYFKYYFGKYPSIIRGNKTSVAVLSGTETDEELSLLGDDVHIYFGLGCRNVTMLYVPEEYDFIPLLNAFKKYHYFIDHTKYKNNYDYNLALLIMNGKFYMTNESIILSENENIFSAVSQLHYKFYKDESKISEELKNKDGIQCTLGKGFIPFGQAQQPSLFDYADGVNTMQFLLSL